MNQSYQLDQTDKSNLQFILSVSNQQLVKWWDTISEDERDYAANLLNYYSSWVASQSSSVIDEKESKLGDQSKWRESRRIIKRIMKNSR